MANPIDVVYLTAVAAASPFLVRRYWRRTDPNWREKLTGQVGVPPKTGPRIWFHGVSVGEIHLLRGVVAAFRHRRPDVEVVVSSTTPTGWSEARKCFPDISVVAWPYDFSWSVQTALKSVRPDLIVLAESELWPGMLLSAQRAQIPIVVINGRFSPKSAANWRRVKPFAHSLFRRISHFVMQNQQYADNLRLLDIPANRISVTGSMKFDGVETNRFNPKTNDLRVMLGLRDDHCVIVAGSTQSPEEQGVLEIFRRLKSTNKRLRLIVVPRQTERFEEVAELLRHSKARFVRRSQLPHSVADDEIILVDTIGELRAVWGLADIAIVGGSFDGKRGGQNMIEPAGYGAAVIFGPHVWNFQQTADQLITNGGSVQVADFEALEAELTRLLNPGARCNLGTAAQRLVASQQGATERTLDVIDRFLPAQLRHAA